MPRCYNKQCGIMGEEYACRYLRQHNYHILERNFRTRYGEIDIIAIDRSEATPILSFIEVKTRVSAKFGSPLEAIGLYKLQALTRTAQYYQLTHPHLPKQLRIDALAITMTSEGKIASVNLVKNIS